MIPIGGWDARTLVGQRVRIHGREDVEGIVGLPPVHLLDAKDKAKPLEVTDLAIDLGLPAERARELVRPGDTATRIRALRPLGDLVTGKSLDDRVGVFVMLEALREAGDSGAEVIATATVQEEVGLRGARVATARIRPDIALAIDTCPANDGPGAPPGGPLTRLGQGTAIRVMDASAICSPAMVELLTRRSRWTGDPAPVPRRQPRRHGHGEPAALGRGIDRRLRLDPDPLRPLQRGGVPPGRHRRVDPPWWPR